MPGLRRKMLPYTPVAVLAGGIAAVALGSPMLGTEFVWPDNQVSYPIRLEMRSVRKVISPHTVPIPPIKPAQSAPLRQANPATPDGASPEVAMKGSDPEKISAGTVPVANTVSGASRRAVANGLLPIRFDLSNPRSSTPSSGAPAIDITKPVRLNGADAGSAVIHVRSDSQLFVERDEIRAIVAKAGLKELADRIGRSGEVSFDELRNKGLAIRYDPVSDRVLVST